MGHGRNSVDEEEILASRKGREGNDVESEGGCLTFTAGSMGSQGLRVIAQSSRNMLAILWV